MTDKQRVLEYVLQKTAPVSRGEVCEQLGIPTSSVARYLEELQSTGEIERSGKGRATVYVADAADAYAYREKLKGPKRDRVPYDFDRIRRYPIDGFSYFTESQKAELATASQIPTGLTHPEYIEAIKRRLLLEASWSSSVLEGNTYSLLDTEELFERNSEMPGARIEETTMLLNHKHAIEYILTNIASVEVSRMDVLNVHALLSNGLLKDPSGSGRLRSKSVGIGQSSYEPLDVSYQIAEEFEVLIDVANRIDDALDKSMYLLLNVAYLQPFIDVNKRTARMMANVPLLKAGLMPMSFFQMSRKGYECGLLHYYETGDFRRLVKEYAASYKISSTRFLEILEHKPSSKDLALRLKFRKQIVEAVRAAVRDTGPSAAFVPSDATAEETAFFHDYVSKCVDGISEANAILYGLSAGEVRDHIEGQGKLPPDRPKG